MKRSFARMLAGQRAAATAGVDAATRRATTYSGHTILATVRELYPDEPLWRQRGPDELGVDRPPFIDLLWGSTALREGIDARLDLAQILERSPRAPQPPTSALLYGTTPTNSQEETL